MKLAACLMLPLPDNKFLAISRRNDTTRWGMPGGKVDPGETVLQAVLREVLEEIGLSLTEAEVQPVFEGVCPGQGPDDTYLVTTFVVTAALGERLNALKPEDKMELAPLSQAELEDPNRSPFATYNAGAFRAYQEQLSLSV